MFTELVNVKGNLEVILLDENGHQKDYRKVKGGYQIRWHPPYCSTTIKPWAIRQQILPALAYPLPKTA